jgi:YcaO-like protein with predicted kinase domain
MGPGEGKMLCIKGASDKALKTFTRGTHRTVAPHVTVARALRVSAVAGITRIANVTGLDTIGVPVVMVCRPNSRSLAVSQGKGLDLDSAKASGLMESLEQYHAETIALPLRLCSYEELRYSNDVVEIETLPVVSPGLFNPHLRLLWCCGTDLVHGSPTFIPYELVHVDFTLPLPPGSGCFPCSSNGLASGNNLMEAISHGICEVFERDATSLWALRNEEAKDRSRVDIETVDSALCCEVLAKFEAAGIDTAVWDTTSDVGIPSFICIIMGRGDHGGRPVAPASGMGCHPTREIALLRALTEAAQSRLTHIAGSRDDAVRDEYLHFHDPQVLRDTRERLKIRRPPRSFRSGASFSADTCEDDVVWLLEQLRGAGMNRVLMVDLTRSEFGIPVVRIIIPGLEGSHKVPGYIPGIRARLALGSKSL